MDQWEEAGRPRPEIRSLSGGNHESRYAKREETEALLREKGIPYFPGLPCIEPEEETELRPAEEVGLRVVCLLCAMGSGTTPPIHHANSI